MRGSARNYLASSKALLLCLCRLGWRGGYPPPLAETHAHHTHQPPAQSRGCRTIRIPPLLTLLLKLLLMLLLLPLLLPPPPPLVLPSGDDRARRCAAGTEHGDHDHVCSASAVVPTVYVILYDRLIFTLTLFLCSLIVRGVMTTYLLA